MSDTLRAALRTGAFAFLTVFVTGLIGWLNDVAGWLTTSEEVAFPDPNVLKVLLLSAVSAGAIALVNGLGIVVQNRAGVGTTPEYTPATPVKDTSTATPPHRV